MHFDLWPAPMRAGLCTRSGGSRRPIRGGVASTPEFGGRQRPKQRPLPSCEMATRRGEAGGARTDVIATSMHIMEACVRLCGLVALSSR